MKKMKKKLQDEGYNAENIRESDTMDLKILRCQETGAVSFDVYLRKRSTGREAKIAKKGK